MLHFVPCIIVVCSKLHAVRCCSVVTVPCGGCPASQARCDGTGSNSAMFKDSKRVWQARGAMRVRRWGAWRA